MTAPTDLRIIAEVGGLAVAERGPLVLVFDRGTGRWATLAFVVGVLALVFGVAAAGAAVVAVGAAVVAVGRIGTEKARPLGDYRPVAVFDRARRVFVDADGLVVAPLDQVRLHRQTQLASSSPALVASTPTGARILKRGNPFNGGSGQLDVVLTGLLFDSPR
jgi:hypothetical protein